MLPGPPDIAFRSAPEQKLVPLPVIVALPAVTETVPVE